MNFRELIGARLLTRKSFYFYCAAYYAVLVAYLFVVRHGLTTSERAVEIVTFVVAITLTLVLATRIDFLLLNYPLHKHLFARERLAHALISKGGFYLRVAFFYLYLVAVPTLLFFLEGAVHFIAIYYGWFLFGTVLIWNLDYLVPDYDRYSRLIAKRQWGPWGTN